VTLPITYNGFKTYFLLQSAFLRIFSFYESLFLRNIF
jgi:hypothetical protein